MTNVRRHPTDAQHRPVRWHPRQRALVACLVAPSSARQQMRERLATSMSAEPADHVAVAELVRCPLESGLKVIAGSGADVF